MKILKQLERQSALDLLQAYGFVNAKSCPKRKFVEDDCEGPSALGSAAGAADDVVGLDDLLELVDVKLEPEDIPKPKATCLTIPCPPILFGLLLLDLESK